MSWPERPGPATLRVEGLSKVYDHHPVLADVTFSMAPGEIAVLAGANGSGKSTLLRCLAGLTRFRGSAAVAGHPVGAGREFRRRFGYLPQSVTLPDAVAVGEVVTFFARLRGADPADLPFPEGFLPPEERPVGVLSGGQRQRVALAVALLGRPPLLLLDEPVANLDERGRDAFWSTLRDLAGEGATALIASPLPADLAGVAGRALVLDDGRVAFDGSMDRVRALEPVPERAPGPDEPARGEAGP